MGLVPLPAFARLSVDVKVPRTQVAPDEGITYQVTAENTQSMQNMEVVFPDGVLSQGIHVSGPSVSQGMQVQIFGGKQEQRSQLTHTYRIDFPKPGKYVISGVYAKIDGRTQMLKPVVVEVHEKYRDSESSDSESDAQDPMSFFHRLFPRDRGFGNLLRPRRLRPPRMEDITLVFQPSSVHVVEGEPVWVKLVAYVHRDYRPMQISPHVELPPQSLFYVEEIRDKVQELAAGNGETVAYLMDELVLYGLRPGKETLDRIRVGLQLVGPDGRAYPVEVNAKPVTITVDPLPAPKPPLPLVGHHLVASLMIENQKSAVVGEPFSFTYVVEGTANIRLIEDVPIVPLEGMDIHVSEDDTFEVLRNPTRFYLQKHGLLVFRNPGSYTIEVAPLRYYHPGKRSYLTTQENKILVHVGAAPPKSKGYSGKKDSMFSEDNFFPLSEYEVLGLTILMVLLGGVGIGLWWVRRKR